MVVVVRYWFPRRRGDRPAFVAHWIPSRMVLPQTRVESIIFTLSVALPSRFGNYRTPATNSAATPTLLRPEGRKPKKERSAARPDKKSEIPQPAPAAKGGDTEAKQDYKALRTVRLEHNETQRKAAHRKRRKERGLCRDCFAEAIPDQTRCETCAENHRQPR